MRKTKERYFYVVAEIELDFWERDEELDDEQSERLWGAEIYYEYPYWADGGAFFGWRNPFKPKHKHRLKEREDEKRRVADLNVIRLGEIRTGLTNMGFPGLKTPQSIKEPQVWKEGKGWVKFKIPEDREGG